MILFAEGILKTHWDQSVPVNVARIARAMSVVVAPGETGDACAILEITPQRTRRVTIASRDSFMRQRYGVAHAIGHVALHHLRPGMRHAIHVSESYHVDYEQRIEREANDFALRLLVPSEVLKFSVLQQHIHSAQELAHLFEVAPILIKQRLADLDLPLPQRLACQVTPDLRWQD